MTRLGLFAASAIVVGAIAAPSQARAEASAWVSVSGGATVLRWEEQDFRVRGSMQFDAGVGTSPANAFIFGTIFRVSPMINEGTDLSLSLRGATRGFQVGDWGIAVDAGAYLRTFGPEPVPSTGFVGGLVLGGPLGTQLSVMTHYGMNQALGVNASLGIDLLRLTVYRESLLQWWPNPMSAGSRTATAK